MGVTWTKERVADLRELWRQGVPSREIAQRLGLTRGMVSGKRYDLGLPPRTGEVRRAAEAVNARIAAARYRNVADAALARREVILRDEVGKLEALIQPLAGSTPRPWELRRPRECAFPVAGWGAGTWSCCEPVELDAGGRPTPYCLGHTAILRGEPWPPVEDLTPVATTRQPRGAVVEFPNV